MILIFANATPRMDGYQERSNIGCLWSMRPRYKCNLRIGNGGNGIGTFTNPVLPFGCNGRIPSTSNGASAKVATPSILHHSKQRIGNVGHVLKSETGIGRSLFRVELQVKDASAFANKFEVEIFSVVQKFR